MVHSVSAISSVKKADRENRGSSGGYSGNRQPNPSFAELLEAEVDERKAAPASCHTVTYGNDCKLRTFLYQTREYSY